MATLVFSAVGAAIGSGFGGTVLGLSGLVIGRAIGATVGRVIDQKLLGAGSDPVEVGRLDRLRLTGASEGASIAQVWGRMRVAGQVIWATQFQEYARRRGGGKGTQPKVTEFSYSISLAIGLCEGTILKVGRVWADGAEIEPGSLTLRIYDGAEDQLPDPKIEAVEGFGKAPAYRGLAYVVIEDLDLTPFGNRVPQFSFEVMRAAQGPGLGDEISLADAIPAVAMIPGTGEYALAATPVHYARAPGQNVSANANTPSGKADFPVSLGHLTSELPNVSSVSLVVAWFGNDLRCGSCAVQPKVEQKDRDGVGMPWRAGGIDRAAAGLVPRIDDRVVYGGTPADASVIEAIRAIRAAGRAVMFYPFVLMDQLEGNSLPDPWTGGAGQPVLPWRGRITTSLAPGLPGTTDRTTAAEAEVTAFFGTALPAHVTAAGETIGYAGPSEWSFRRFILHYARLCQIAGGVDAFCIGSELRGITRIRGASDSFPAVAALRQLAADVRSVLGPDCKISYAADWTEYGSYVADENVYFPLDALWADTSIDFVGIDNYMPLSDWRNRDGEADAAWGSIYNLDYLTANIAGGEGFDWYYDSPEGEEVQTRLPIEDGAFDEPWLFRVKDLRGWWGNEHHARTGAVRAALPTAWVPQSKPICFTEYGCAALDKGANQPNKFIDLTSSESALPRASNGRRDDLMQLQYFRAMARYWTDPANNPVSLIYGAPMLDFARAHAWAWDARPFPAFPGRTDLWSDGEAYARGHWLNGRATNQPLAAVVREIAARAGVGGVETSQLYGLVRGYVQDQSQSARASLQPLMLAFGVDAAEREGKIAFLSRRGGVDHELQEEACAQTADTDGYAELTRSAAPETSGMVRLNHVDAEGDYEVRSSEARYPDEEQRSVSASEVPLALTPAEGRIIAHRWLAESRIARDSLRLALPPSRRSVGAGDRVRLEDGSTYRIDRVEQAEARLIEATRIEGGVYDSGDVLEEPGLQRPFVSPVPVYPVFLDLPILTGTEVPHAPHVAVTAEPWPGAVAVWSASADTSFEVNRLVAAPSIIGITETELAAARQGLWDRGSALRVRVTGGALSSASALAVLNGANAMAIGDGSGGNWEVFQFAQAALVAPQTYEISMRLRGQLGTDGIMPPVWPVGSTVVLLDQALVQIDLAASARGLARNYRIGVTARGFDDPNVVSIASAFDGIGLRPYPVAHLEAQGAAGSDLHISWNRRTRIEGDGWQQIEVPLGEETEAYLVRVLSGATVLVEYTVSDPEFDYPAAAQTVDGAVAPFGIEVAQLSQRFGAGPFRRVEIPA
ncbi:glycoside hydrolase TIM-barrel-like domain-containing protein [Neotabrizicola sp. sgz301269]|uniref:baseplate multidomain protein megatron n=1 Tax=Neotabrizicola sp. sgz301269 TaxID=3276282 RepID=UPI00376F9F3F